MAGGGAAGSEKRAASQEESPRTGGYAGGGALAGRAPTERWTSGGPSEKPVGLKLRKSDWELKEDPCPRIYDKESPSPPLRKTQ